MGIRMFTRVSVVLLLCMGTLLASKGVYAQTMDFSRIDKFESIGTATIHGGSPSKTIIDDDDPHAVFITIWESDTDAKVYWKTLDGKTHKTTVIHGIGVQAFQIAGELRLEALGDPSRTVKFGYLLLGIEK